MWFILLVVALTAVTDSRLANKLSGEHLTFVVYHVSRSISLLCLLTYFCRQPWK